MGGVESTTSRLNNRVLLPSTTLTWSYDMGLCKKGLKYSLQDFNAHDVATVNSRR